MQASTTIWNLPARMPALSVQIGARILTPPRLALWRTTPQADTDHDVAEGWRNRVQAIDMDKVAVRVGEQRHQSDRAEGFSREGGAHPPDGEPVEGQINGEENHAERQVGGVVDQKRPCLPSRRSGTGLTKPG